MQEKRSRCHATDTPGTNARPNTFSIIWGPRETGSPHWTWSSTRLATKLPTQMLKLKVNQVVDND